MYLSTEMRRAPTFQFEKRRLPSEGRECMLKFRMKELAKEAVRLLYVIILTIIGPWVGNGLWNETINLIRIAHGGVLVLTYEQAQILDGIWICVILVVTAACEAAAIKVAEWGIQ